MKLVKSELVEGKTLIDLVSLKEKEPELYEELLADYPISSDYVMISQFSEVG